MVSPAVAEGTIVMLPFVLTKRKYWPFTPPSNGRLIVKAEAESWTRRGDWRSSLVRVIGEVVDGMM